MASPLSPDSECESVTATASDAVDPQVTSDVCDRPCTEEHLAQITMSIVDWRRLSPFLGLTEPEEMDILGANPHSVPAQKIAMLRKWKQKKGRAATYNQLCRVFRMCELVDLEDKMKEIIAEVGKNRCVCQMFCQEMSLNYWKVVFIFMPSVDCLEQVKMMYKGFNVYESPFDCQLTSSGSDRIEPKVLNKTDGWDMIKYRTEATTAAVEQYTGEGDPPYCEMILRAVSNKTTPPDLTVDIQLEGVEEPTIIKFEKEAQNVVECVCQVFYHKIALNHWRARFAFFPKQHQAKVNQFYQNTDSSPCLDVKFGGGVIKVSTANDTVIPAGWEVTIDKQHQQVTIAAVEQYTGEGDPPYCEMRLRVVDFDVIDKSALNILQLVTLIGVREPNNIFLIERAIEDSDSTTSPKSAQSKDIRCICQVFYHKGGINLWKVTLAFFTADKFNRVKQFYLDANLGPTIDSIEFTDSSEKVIQPSIETVSGGWNVYHTVLTKVRKIDILGYDGIGQPPYCEMIFRTVSNKTTPPDLTVDVKFNGVKEPHDVIKLEKSTCAFCHIFCKEVGLNSWRIFFVFVPLGADLELMKMFYQDFQVYGSPFICHLKSFAAIQVEVFSSTYGWNIHTSDFQVHKAAIMSYTGEGSPPHIEMTITADSDKTTPPDLTVEAKLKGVQEPNIIKFEKEAQNVVECVCQVFFHKIALNYWRARFALFPKKYRKKVNEFYQDACNSIPYDIKFSGGAIQFFTDQTVTPAGWKVIIDPQYQLMLTAAVEQYTGEGGPPYCEMVLIAGDYKSALVILQPVTLIGVRKQPYNTFNVKRTLEAPDGSIMYTPKPSIQSTDMRCICQVFFHKEWINHWKATLVFITKAKLDRVKQLYQGSNLGLTVEDIHFSAIVGRPTASFSINSVSDGWNLVHTSFKTIFKQDVLEYNGMGKPPHCEVIFKAVSDVNTPPDFTATISYGGIFGFGATTFTISRIAETPLEMDRLHYATINTLDTGFPVFSTMDRYREPTSAAQETATSADVDGVTNSVENR